jgi:enediyne biosynthesis protein E3
MAHVGAGWVIARLPLPPAMVLRHLDPLLKWLALDGCGFHDGYFHASALLGAAIRPPRRLVGYQRCAFDQGLGRALWFAAGGDADRIPRIIAAFAPERRADLWSGIGLACTYAGGMGTEVVTALRDEATSNGYFSHVAQGAAFAAKARERAGNPTPHTGDVCRVLCGMSASEAACITDEALESIGLDEGTADCPRYERWRAAIRAHFDEKEERRSQR